MKDTGFWLAEADRPRLATVYTRNTTTGSLEVFEDAANFLADDPFSKGSHFESGGGGASGLFSTLHDVVRFTQMLLDKGELGGQRILKPETVDSMMQNHIGDLRGVLGGAAMASAMVAGSCSRDRPRACRNPRVRSAISASTAHGSGLMPRTSFRSWA